MNLYKELEKQSSYYEVLIKILNGEFVENSKNKSNRDYFKSIRSDYNQLLIVFKKRVSAIIPKNKLEVNNLYKSLIPKEDFAVLFFNNTNGTISMQRKLGFHHSVNISIKKYHDHLIGLMKDFPELQEQRNKLVSSAFIITTLHFVSIIDGCMSTHNDGQNDDDDSAYVRDAIAVYEKGVNRKPKPSSKTINKYQTELKGKIHFNDQWSLEEHIAFFKSVNKRDTNGDLTFKEYRRPLIEILQKVTVTTSKREFFIKLFGLIPFLSPTIWLYKKSADLREKYDNLDDYQSKIAKYYFGY